MLANRPGWTKREQRMGVEQLAVVAVGLAESRRPRVGRDDATDDEAVLAEPVEHPVELAFEEHVAARDEHAVDGGRGKTSSASSAGFESSGSRGEAARLACTIRSGPG